jgi:hypothetical protein
MKKQLLFTIAFLAGLTFASAQTATITNTAQYVDATAGEQSFHFGKEAGDTFKVHTELVTIDSGDGISQDNNDYIAITGQSTAPNNNDSNTTATVQFYIKSDGTTNDTRVLLQIETRLGNTVEGTISIDGYPAGSRSFNFTSDGTTANTLQLRSVEFGSLVSLSTNPLLVTVVLSKIERQSVTAASLPTVRLKTLKLEKSGTLSTNDFDLNKASIVAYPNPVTNSFQINSNEDIEAVSLYNISGLLVKTFKAQDNYDISDLATGTYIANIKTQSGSKSLKIVKK